ncbi:MAG: type II toxin-antitoxin system prevent-host-death family antitoxin [Candidatus Omnitrophica bacterium]|nr:type II toxin-antitoxin system prevent-host-death family antitoxin [Candidatus Omnitrophota bacterium]
MNMPAGLFKAKCLELMDKVERLHEEIIITKYGRPVAKLVPVEEGGKKSLVGFLKGSVVIRGDIVGPTGVKWEADR